MRSLIAHRFMSKIKLNLPISRIIHESRAIMVNKGRIHRELGKFFMISLNSIKSDDESMIEIGKINILRKRTQRQIHRINWANEFDFDFVEKSKIE